MMKRERINGIKFKKGGIQVTEMEVKRINKIKGMVICCICGRGFPLIPGEHYTAEELYENKEDM